MQSSNQHATVAVVVIMVVVTASRGKTVCYAYLTSLLEQHSPAPTPRPQGTPQYHSKPPVCSVASSVQENRQAPRTKEQSEGKTGTREREERDRQPEQTEKLRQALITETEQRWRDRHPDRQENIAPSLHSKQNSQSFRRCRMEEEQDGQWLASSEGVRALHTISQCGEARSSRVWGSVTVSKHTGLVR